MRTTSVRLLLLAAATASLACSGPDDRAPTAPDAPSLARTSTATLTPTDHAAQLALRVNSALQAKGSKLRLTGAYFFTVGLGVPPYRSHNFDARWPYRNLTYYLDASDFTTDAPASAVETALVNAYETWDAVPNVRLNLTRVPDTQSNPDLLDAIHLDNNGDCTDIVDATWQGPYADIVSGGWLSPEYFSNCLGSSDIIAVTWTFTDSDDLNHDQYDDILYVEQFFNSGWGYVTSGSVRFDFDGPFDIQSIAVHEDGHALGLAHTGGPNPNQPLRIRGNGQVFTPEAVMNPASLGGEMRVLLPLDLASLRQLYTRVN